MCVCVCERKRGEEGGRETHRERVISEIVFQEEAVERVSAKALWW